jgi:hypothetical protein
MKDWFSRMELVLALLALERAQRALGRAERRLERAERALADAESARAGRMDRTRLKKAGRVRLD